MAQNTAVPWQKAASIMVSVSKCSGELVWSRIGENLGSLSKLMNSNFY